MAKVGISVRALIASAVLLLVVALALAGYGGSHTPARTVAKSTSIATATFAMQPNNFPTYIFPLVSA